LVASAMMAQATVYTVYEKNSGKDWSGSKESAFTTTVDVNGETFTLTYDKADNKSNDLRNPGTEKYSWRLYKSTSMSIESADVVMKGIRFTIDNADSGKYAVEGTTGTGWTGTLDKSAFTYTFNNAAGSQEFTFGATTGQVRITKIEVSTEEFEAGETPVDPVDPDPAETTSVKSIAETIALADGTKVKVDYQTIVAFVNGKNCFVQDAAGDFIQIYNANSYAVNDIIPAGWDATYKYYNNVTPELTDATLPESTEKGEFKPAVVAASTITNDMVNSVIAVKDVELAEASPATKDNFTGTSEGTTLSLRNNYGLESVAAGTYNLTLLVQVYKGELSLYVINYDADVNSTGVEAVEVIEGAAEYYTLQGVKVANPEKGLYIRVAGGKATKIAVK
ncbi:MAG: hypothetical protein K2H86_03830, partial [Muribaculaceae bacterium]|nr:hypothetical protein [Muribaculaceae bacterium]